MALQVGELFAKLSLDSEQFSKALTDAGKSMEKMGDKIKDVGKDMTTKITAPIVGLGVASIKVAADFEQGMSKVKAVSGATGKEFDKLKKMAFDLGAETQFSARDAADAMGFLAMAGFKTNEILGAMPGTLELAAVANLDMGRAADIVSNILTGYGFKVEQLGRVNDVMAKAMTSSNVDLTMLGESMKYAGPVANALGMEFEEAAAAIGMMGNAGIQGGMAGTSLRGILTRLASPTKQNAELMEKLGIHVYDTKGKMLPLVDIIKQLEKSGADAATLMEIFGDRAGPAMAALLEQGSGELDKFTNSLRNSGGTASEMAAVMRDNFNVNVWDEFTSAMEGAAITIGDLLLPIATDLIKKLTDLFGWLTNLDPETQKWIISIAGLAAAIGPLLVVVGTLIKSVGIVSGAIAAVSAPVWIAIGAIVALGAIFVYLWETNETFREKVLTAWEAIKAGASQIWEAISGKLAAVWETLKETFSSFVDLFNLIWDTWGNNIMRQLGIFATFIKDVFITLWNTVVGVFDGALKIINGILDIFIGIFTGDWRRVWDGILDILGGVIEIIVSLVVGLFKTLGEIIILAWDTLKNAFSFLWEGIKAIFMGIVTTMGNLGADMMRGFLNGITGMFSSIRDRVEGFVSDMVNKVKGVLGIHSPSRVFADIGKNVGLGLAKGIESTARLVERATDAITPEMAVEGPASLGGGADGGTPSGGPMVVQMMLDGRLVTQTVMQYMPGETKRLGGR